MNRPANRLPTDCNEVRLIIEEAMEAESQRSWGGATPSGAVRRVTAHGGAPWDIDACADRMGQHITEQDRTALAVATVGHAIRRVYT